MIWFRYVLHEQVPAYEAKGWKVYAPMMGNHGNYSTLMIFEGDNEPN